MFKAKTAKIEALAAKSPHRITELESLLTDRVNMYIDYANVRPWSEKLGWNIDIKRLKQFLNSFDNVFDINYYNGTHAGNQDSEEAIKRAIELKYKVHTKPVKIMEFSVDVRGIASKDDRSLVKQFIRKSLLRKYDAITIEYLNQKFIDMNTLGEFSIKDMKCNFDVEIGVDILLDAERKAADTFVLWSGDSDFHDALSRLLKLGKKAIVFGTAGRISRELNGLTSDGLIIFDIQKIREFICWNKEMKNA